MSGPLVSLIKAAGKGAVRAVKKGGSLARPAVKEVEGAFGKVAAQQYAKKGGTFSNQAKDFYPTSERVAERMLDWLSEGGTRNLGRTIEPHGGEGHLVAEIVKRTGAMPDVLEIDPNRVMSMREKGIPAILKDYLEHDELYDSGVLNPPFSEGQDKIHFLHAIKHLKPGGKVASVVDSRRIWKGRPLRRFLDSDPNAEIIATSTNMKHQGEKGKYKSVAIIGYTKPKEVSTIDTY